MNHEKGLSTSNSHALNRTRLTGPRKRREGGPVVVLDGPRGGERQREDEENRNLNMREAPTKGSLLGSEKP